MGLSPLNIGWIPYWNLLPLQHELTRISGGSLKLQAGHPTTVNKWLQDGTVNVAPASSIAMLKYPKLEMALPLGIASEGPVLSVYLGLRGDDRSILDFIQERQAALAPTFKSWVSLSHDPRLNAKSIWSELKVYRPSYALVPRLYLTSASAASAALTRVMLHLWYGESVAGQILSMASCVDARQYPAGESALELVIGDEALQRRHEFKHVIDLGKVWHDLTGLPFVFGLWQSSVRSLSSGFKSLILEAASVAQARMRIEPQTYFPRNTLYCGNGDQVDLANYWKVIHYKLEDRHFRSLLLYYALYLETCARRDESCDAERMTRWSRTWADSAGGVYL